MTGTKPKVFHGWWIALAGSLALFLSTVTIVIFPFGIFAGAIAQEFHAGRAKISLAFGIHSLTAALCFPIAGRLVDRLGARRVLIPSMTLLGLILVCSRFLSGSLWELYVFYFALGTLGGSAGAMPYTVVISHWFDRRRGLALSVVMAGLAVGAIVIPPVAQHLVRTLGWRMAYSVFGIAILLIPLPLVIALLKETPESMGFLPDGATRAHASDPDPAREFGLTFRETIRTSAFWIMACAFFLVTASVHACFIHLPAMMADRGAAGRLAALASSLFGVGILVGRIGCGYLLDVYFAPRVSAALFAAVTTGLGFLAVGHAIWAAFAGAFLVGLGLGAETDIMAYLVSRYFGLRSYGAIFGWIWAIFGLSGGLGAFLMGLGFDKTGSYVVPLTGFVCASVLATLLIMSLGPYRYRVGATQVQELSLREAS
ncbi:MAG: MFS transporter [Candidatus Sulfotelmatobacter sp.]